MSDCCSSSSTSNKSIKKYTCPVNGKTYAGVLTSTVMHHIDQPWLGQIKSQSYYFCNDPDCDVVYFSQDGSVINKSQLRTVVGIKEYSDNALICYCFGVTVQQASINPEIKKFVVQQTKSRKCACTIRNPSGRCCLKDFPKS